MTDTIERLPPHSREAERCVLGSMLRDNGVICDVVRLLCVEDFYADAHQKVFAAAKAISEKGSPVDLEILANTLKDRKQIEDIGGYGYLGELWDAAPTAANAEYYAIIVREKARTRNLIHVATEILRDAYDQTGPADELVATAERKIMNLAYAGTRNTLRSLSEVLPRVNDAIDDRKTGRVKKGAPTGLIDLDDAIGGLRDGALIVIAARPGCGKTMLVGQVLVNVIRETGKSAILASLEQPAEEIAERLLSGQANVSAFRMREGLIDDDESARLVDGYKALTSCALFIEDAPHQNAFWIGAAARQVKARRGLSAIAVDYLQLVEPEDRRLSEPKQLAGISRRLKILSRELSVPVIALSQFNRNTEAREGQKPRLADLYGSGAIEADADLVIALHHPPGRPGEVDALILKNRHGSPREIALRWRPEFMRFENLLPEYPEPSANGWHTNGVH